jgi:ribosomal-protein-alanine N-acetyltransferase
MIALAGRAATAAQWNTADYEALFKPGAVPRHSLVLEAADVVQAFIVAKQVGQSWEIENIVTAAEARRCGFATRLLAEMMSIAYDSGAHDVSLEVRKSNEAARALYVKCGFVEAGRRAAYYTSPVEDAIIFRYFFPKKFLEIVEAK